MQAEPAPATSVWRRLVDIKPQERKAFVWASLYFFFLLFGYYLVRPVRSALGATDEKLYAHLPMLFAINLALMLLINPLYGLLTSRFKRHTLVPIVYHFFALCWLGLCVAWQLAGASHQGVVAGIFYVWISVFNLFVVSVFWDVLVDTFTTEQGTRLFGLIGVAGTLGSIVGALVAGRMAEAVRTNEIKPIWSLLGSAGLLEVATVCAWMLIRSTRPLTSSRKAEEKPPGKGMFSGIRAIGKSSYLLGICGYVLILAVAGALFYLQQNHLAKLAVEHKELSPGKVIAYFANLEFWSNVVTLALQLLVARMVLAKLGSGKTLMLMPLFTVVAFVLLAFGAFSPLMLMLWIQVMARALEFSLVKPARKLLFTILGRDEKYSTQSFVDTFVQRGGEVVVVWICYAMQVQRTGIRFQTVLLWSLPIFVLWFFLSWKLGNDHHKNKPPTLRTEIA